LLSSKRFGSFDFVQGVLEKTPKAGRRNFMSNDNNNRVLNRTGARQLTKQEIEQITGAAGPFTHASHIPTGSVSSPDVGYDS
jgi:hypothetical protein